MSGYYDWRTSGWLYGCRWFFCWNTIADRSWIPTTVKKHPFSIAKKMSCKAFLEMGLDGAYHERAEWRWMATSRTATLGNKTSCRRVGCPENILFMWPNKAFRESKIFLLCEFHNKLIGDRNTLFKTGWQFYPKYVFHKIKSCPSFFAAERKSFIVLCVCKPVLNKTFSGVLITATRTSQFPCAPVESKTRSGGLRGGGAGRGGAR